ncbi:hypothetical protein HBH89_114770 [Parastagonospora nodorum]|nr:hypothetical protein HBH89_114770 [Parastagonospora nodorum]KAH5304024.1 hypothetical protein HBI11_125530 [Parastagonospora nodorum]KAH5478361.1 hypothetical protein HBI31_186780 [Parastagonospora nodorum]KAH5538227.1 hypothetical protein HBI27_131900 [Parastagonospora nodorum]KAH6260352.1 hypothetical protein HBI41_139030 [Parastagonospora nodorum]
MTLLALLSLIFHRHFTMPAISTSGANLDTLPSELRKFTVPYLAPEVDNFREGYKYDLKNASSTPVLTRMGTGVHVQGHGTKACTLLCPRRQPCWAPWLPYAA